VADITKTVSVIFQGKDEASAAVNKIEQSLDSVGSTTTTKVLPGLEKVDDELKKVGDAAPAVD
jgi:hypothetical protein